MFRCAVDRGLRFCHILGLNKPTVLSLQFLTWKQNAIFINFNSNILDVHFVWHQSLKLFWAVDQRTNYYLDSHPLPAINVAKLGMIGRGGIGWPKDDVLIVHLEPEVHFEQLVWLKLKTCIAKTNFIFHSIISNLPEICWVLAEPGENWVVEFPFPMHTRLSWHQLEEGIPQMIPHQDESSCLRDQKRCVSFLKWGSFICNTRQME